MRIDYVFPRWRKEPGSFFAPLRRGGKLGPANSTNSTHLFGEFPHLTLTLPFEDCFILNHILLTVIHTEAV